MSQKVPLYFGVTGVLKLGVPASHGNGFYSVLGVKRGGRLGCPDRNPAAMNPAMWEGAPYTCAHLLPGDVIRQLSIGVCIKGPVHEIGITVETHAAKTMLLPTGGMPMLHAPVSFERQVQVHPEGLPIGLDDGVFFTIDSWTPTPGVAVWLELYCYGWLDRPTTGVGRRMPD